MNLPCTECPVLAICITKAKEWVSPPDFSYFISLIDCDRAKDYVQYLEVICSKKRKQKINEARKLFRIQTLPRKFGSPFYAAIEVRKKGSYQTEYFTKCDCSLYKYKFTEDEIGEMG